MPPLRISFTEPPHGSSSHPVVDPIKIYFTVDLDQASVNAGSVVLLNLDTKQVQPGSVSYASRCLTFVPERLVPATHYQFLIIGGEKGIRDVLGNSLEQTQRLEFVTAGDVALSPPLLVAPVDQSVVQGAPAIAWQALGDDVSYVVQLSSSQDFLDVIWSETVSTSPDVNGLVSVQPALNLLPGMYYVRVQAVGGPFSQAVGFAVSSEESELFPSVLPLELIEAIPGQCAAHVQADAIVLRFNQEVDASTVAGNVYLVELPL